MTDLVIWKELHLPAPSRWTAVLTCVLLAAGCARDAEYPSRPVVLICPWAAGGGTDRVSRQVAVLLERELGVPVNVVNATGGGGVTGHTRGALARPDGYTLTMITVELNMLHWRGLTNITHDDFRPLMQLNRDDAALFVRADAPWRSLAELEAEIRAHPGTLKASGTAQGGIWHVSLAGWLDAIGGEADDVTWISINGSAPSLQELLSGGVAMVCCSLPEAENLLDAGEIRCLGVMADERLAAYPDAPTFREQGSAWSIGGWRGLALPLGVPEERFGVLLAALQRVVHNEAYRNFMTSNGFNSSILGPAEFAAALETDDATFRTILTGEAFRSVRQARYGPYVFPIALGGAIGLALLVMLVRGDLRRPEEELPITGKGAARVGLTIAGVMACAAAMETVGFVIAGVGLMLAMLRLLRVRWRTALPLTLVLVPLSYTVFAVGLRVPLPWGWLGW